MARCCCVLTLAAFTSAVMGCVGQEQPGFLGKISGQIFEAQSGRVITGMTVMAVAREVTDGGLSLTPAGRAGRTDAKGRYEITGLAPGEYLVAAGGNLAVQIRALGARRSEEPQVRGMHYLNSRDPYIAKTVVMWGGADAAGIDFRLTPEEAYAFRGSMQGVPGVAPVTMFLASEPRWRDDLFFGKLSPLRPGPFEIGPLLPGKYWLYAYSGERSDPGFRAGCQRVEIRGPDSASVGVVMAPAFPVAVKLFGGRTGLPPGGSDLRLQIELTPLIAQPTAKISPTLRAAIGSSGRAVVENVTAEPYQVSVSGLPRDWVVRRIAYNGVALADPIVEFSPRDSLQRLEVVVEPVNNSLAIRALDFNMPAAGAVVVMAPEWLLARQMGYTGLRWIMPANGVVEYGIVPGSYRALALPPGSTWGAAMHLLYEGSGQKIKVEDGSAQSATLELWR